MISPSATPASIRTHNLSLVLNLIWKQGTLSRTDINRETKLSASAVSALVNVLLDSGFILETGVGKSSGGRRPTLLEFNSQVRFALGVDVGSSHITALAMRLDGTIIAQDHLRMDVISQPEETLNEVERIVKQLVRKAGIAFSDCLGMGFTLPVPMTGEKHDRMMTYYMPAWETHPLIPELEQRFQVPVLFENDANGGVIAEQYWGMGKNHENLALVKLGTGVGCGLVINGSLFRGYRGSAGEIGHTTIEPNGRLCRCGNRGCIESYVGIAGVIAAVCERYEAESLPIPMETPLTIEAIVAASQNGNQICQDVIRNAGSYLGIAVANLLNMVNPSLVVLGGELVHAGDLLLDSMRATMEERVIPIESQQSELVISQLGDNVVALGAATIVIHHAFLPANIIKTLGKQEFA